MTKFIYDLHGFEERERIPKSVPYWVRACGGGGEPRWLREVGMDGREVRPAVAEE